VVEVLQAEQAWQHTADVCCLQYQLNEALPQGGSEVWHDCVNDVEVLQADTGWERAAAR
jgi:hypothetical protein